MDPNDDCEDMKCRCQKCPQTQHLDQKMRLIGPFKGGGVGWERAWANDREYGADGRTRDRRGGRMWGGRVGTWDG